MSTEHRKKDERASALEPLLTRDELAARWRVTKQHVTRNYQRMGLRPVKVGKRCLFPVSQIIEAERLAQTGEVQR